MIDSTIPTYFQAMSISSHLLTVPSNARLTASNRQFLASLFNNKTSFHNHADQTILKHVAIAIQEFEDNDKVGYQWNTKVRSAIKS